MTEQEILNWLAGEGAVLTDSHFVLTSERHSTAYVNMRSVAHQAGKLASVGMALGDRIGMHGADVVLGPETLGRTLADHTALNIAGRTAVWCGFTGEGFAKRACFKPNFDFTRLIAGKRVAIVDDLLTTGGSIRLAADLVVECGGTPVMGIAVVRRSPDVTASDCHVPRLEFLADVQGFQTFTEAECQAYGPCSRGVPMVLNPGHGYEWINSNPDYPVAE